MNTIDRKTAGLILTAENQTPARDPKWIVVRCPAGDTLDYERELERRGISIWTPWAWVRKRLPRRKIKVWTMVPILPSYLFVSIRDLPTFGALPRDVLSELPAMTILGKFVVLNERDLEGLRSLDDREEPGARVSKCSHLPEPEANGEAAKGRPGLGTPAAVKKIWAVGEAVKVRGILSGAEGVVVRVHSDGEVSVAIKNSPITVRVSGFLLSES